MIPSVSDWVFDGAKSWRHAKSQIILVAWLCQTQLQIVQAFWQNEAKLCSSFNSAIFLGASLGSGGNPRLSPGRLLVATAVAAAMSLGPSRSLRDALVCTDGDRRRGHVRELHPANLRDVRAGGDCGQPRLLHSEPALAGAPPGGPGDRTPAKPRQLLTDAVAPP